MAAYHGITARDEWRWHWKVALAATLGYSAAGLSTFGFGPFIVPIEKEFGWSRVEVMAGLSIAGLLGMAVYFVMGLVIDKFGARPVGLFGVTMKTLGFAMLATATGTVLNWMLLWGLVAIGTVCIQTSVWTSVIARKFNVGRGFAIALTLSGTSLSAFLAPLLATAIAAGNGWRFGMAGLGLVWFAVVFPTVFFLFRDNAPPPASSSAPPSASPAGDAATHGPQVVLPAIGGASLAEGLRMRAFWFLMLANFVFVFYTVALATNLVPMLTSRGLSVGQAAQLAAIVGLFSLGGRLFAGFLLDRFPATIVAPAIFAVPVIGCALMLTDSSSFVLLAIAVAAFGTTVGAEFDVVYYLLSRHLGMKHFGSFAGVLLTFSSTSAVCAPLITGFLYDYTGGYTVLLATLTVMMICSLVAMILIGRPKRDWGAAPAH